MAAVATVNGLMRFVPKPTNPQCPGLERDLLGKGIEALVEVLLFVALAQVLDLPQKAEKDTAVVAAAVKRWLEENSGWLLVLANADEPKHVEEFLPQNPQGHILLTSRASIFRTLGISAPLRLEEMEPQEALEFLFKSTECTASAEEEDASTELAKELGYLPLALEQAAAFVAAARIRFQDYLSAYRSQRLKILNKAKPKDYPESVATTWSLNFEEVEKTSTAAAVATSLNNLALLYHDQSKLADAEPLYQRALAIQEKALGPEHAEVATVLVNLSALLKATGRGVEAEDLGRRAREIRARHAERSRAPQGS